jgi:hypothetical protein
VKGIIGGTKQLDLPSIMLESSGYAGKIVIKCGFPSINAGKVEVQIINEANWDRER